MTDSISGINFSNLTDHSLLGHNNHENLKTASQAVKGRIVNSGLKVPQLQNTLAIEQGLLNHINGSKNNHGVTDLNLQLANISQLRSDKTSIISDLVKRYKELEWILKDREGDSSNNKETDNDDMDELYVVEQIESHIKMLLVNIQMYLIDIGSTEPLKIVVLYDVLLSSTLVYKQLFTVVPYNNGYPLGSSSELSIIDEYGNCKSVTKPSRIIDGGFKYSNDWITIEVQGEYLTQVVQEVMVQCGSSYVKGFSLNYDLEMTNISQQTIHNIYIKDFLSVW
jgi:hypothetical protein